MTHKKRLSPVYVMLRGARNKDFHVRVLKDERLVGTVQSLDSHFDEDMYNYGDMNDLPESDRIMICQQRGIKQESCPAEY